MNYRHAFHAGNFADCMKHALLVWMLGAMQRKPGGVMVLDTHAGAGRYDLGAGAAERTGEWRGGIGRLRDDTPAPLAEYVARVEALGLYPGSPLLLGAMLRPQDRLVCCELEPDTHRALRRAMADIAAPAVTAVHRRDGYAAMAAFLPPAERRALVLVDPPYEAADEAERVAAALRAGWRRFPAGVFAAWYPIKHRAPVRTLHATLRDSFMRDVVAAELWLRPPLDPGRLNGCGLVVVNPPFGFADAARPMLDALAAWLGDAEGAGGSVERLVEE